MFLPFAAPPTFHHDRPNSKNEKAVSESRTTPGMTETGRSEHNRGEGAYNLAVRLGADRLLTANFRLGVRFGIFPAHLQGLFAKHQINCRLLLIGK